MKGVLPLLERIASLFEVINEWMGRAISWLSLLMVLVTFTVVVLRYAFDLGWIWLQESVTFMHGALFLVGAAYTLKHDGHVRVDIFFQGFSTQKKAWVDLLGSLLLLMPVCLFIFVVSWGYVAQSWSLHEGSREAGGLDGVYLFKSLMLLMAGLLLLQGVSTVIRCVSRLLGKVDRVEAGSDG
ncbi:TRAP transporter small permease subunit [Candidatus Thiodiazotropha sp. CDECU1]|uniref:TRAP transporter small permease subunit n=1 Tax=Candidatus Thiodiazotropha sp. CDECU1 TaxID=3065865 RepID=UPI00292D6E61|nr:TRAP transporter small permease subunit [Candidatus Thiodiazotropha sp. CDECU1]